MTIHTERQTDKKNTEKGQKELSFHSDKKSWCIMLGKLESCWHLESLVLMRKNILGWLYFEYSSGCTIPIIYRVTLNWEIWFNIQDPEIFLSKEWYRKLSVIPSNGTQRLSSSGVVSKRLHQWFLDCERSGCHQLIGHGVFLTLRIYNLQYTTEPFNTESL